MAGLLHSDHGANAFQASQHASAPSALVWVACSALITSTAATVALALATAAFAAGAGEIAGRVVNVHDGDTLTVLVERRQVKVRLASIDAPELAQAFGRASRAELASMCAGRTADVVESGRDRYGRTIGDVRCGAVHANAEQVCRGMAWVYTQYAPRDSTLYALEAEARTARRGLWSDRDPVEPWSWRASQRLR